VRLSVGLHQRLDETPVWSIVCLFIAKAYRHKGVALSTIHAAIEYVRSQGGKILEAYPTIPEGKQLPPVSSFMGVPSLFQQAGFVECARPSQRKLIMRYDISGTPN